jgi:hypothetical protein
MPTRTKKDELSEWPGILEGVDVWPKAKWPRRLDVTHGPLDLVAIGPHGKPEDVIIARLTYDLEKADGCFVENMMIFCTLEHAGSGFARMTYDGITCRVALKDIKPFVELSLSAEQAVELAARGARHAAGQPKRTVLISKRRAS